MMVGKLLSFLDVDFSGAMFNFGSVPQVNGSIHEAADSQNGPQILQVLCSGAIFIKPGGGCAIFVVGRRQLEIACLHVLEIAG